MVTMFLVAIGGQLITFAGIWVKMNIDIAKINADLNFHKQEIDEIKSDQKELIEMKGDIKSLTIQMKTVLRYIEGKRNSDE